MHRDTVAEMASLPWSENDRKENAARAKVCFRIYLVYITVFKHVCYFQAVILPIRFKKKCFQKTVTI